MSSSKHIFIVSGDASGDVYGAQLIEALQRREPGVTIAGLGGDRMAATGMIFLYNLVREFSVMGFVPVILGMPKVMRFLEIILDYFAATPPDIVVLIDYPGFNLYLSTFTKKRKLRTVYYVTPQIWAWAPWRIKKIKRFIDKMLVIFPFEVPFYQAAAVPVEYVGHPLLDRMALFSPDPDFMLARQITASAKVLGLLPGSRRSEIKGNLPVMLWLASELGQVSPPDKIFLALASDKYRALVANICEQHQRLSLPPLEIVIGKTYDVIHHSHAILVTSGTATLETAMLGTPMVVIYRVPKLHKWVAESTSFLKCRYFALPNIISGQKIVPEHLVVGRQSPVAREDLYAIWEDTPTRRQCLQTLTQMRQKLERPGASERAAAAILHLIQKENL